MITIDIDKINKLKEEADKIFIDPKGEDVLVELLNIQQEIEKAIDEVKIKLEDSALKLNPDFSSIQGDRVKVFYREYGSKYYVDETQADLIPGGLVKSRTVFSVDSKAVENYIAEKGQMPTGIKEVERKKTMSISLKNGK